MTPTHVSQMLRDAARRWPESPALIDSEGVVTFARLSSQAAAIAHWLETSGVLPGDRVICAGESSPAMVAALLGVLDHGATIVPVHPQTPRSALAALIRDSNPSAVCVSTAMTSVLRPVFEGPLLTLPHSDVTNGYVSRPGTEAPSSATEDIAALIYTSGSTGPPRAVVCPHRAVCFAVDAIGSLLDYRTTDVVLCVLPFSFDYGLYQVFLALRAGATLAFPGTGLADIHLLPAIMRKFDVTVFPANPSLVSLLLRSGLLARTKLPSLRLLTSTGEVFHDSSISRLVECFPNLRVAPMYGLTECKRVSICPPDLVDRPPGSVGLPLPGTGIRIVDNRGKEVPIGEVGELVVRGPHVMAGYWNAPQETADRFRCGEDGRMELWTHDLFRQDRNGFLYFVSRSHSVIKSLGHRVSPAEIEHVIASLPWVAEVAVVGVPNDVRGEDIVAFVVTDQEGCENALRDHCWENLVPAACPVQYHLRSAALPKTRHGKVDREGLRAEARSSTSRQA